MQEDLGHVKHNWLFCVLLLQQEVLFILLFSLYTIFISIIIFSTLLDKIHKQKHQFYIKFEPVSTSNYINILCDFTERVFTIIKLSYCSNICVICDFFWLSNYFVYFQLCVLWASLIIQWLFFIKAKVLLWKMCDWYVLINFC